MKNLFLVIFCFCIAISTHTDPVGEWIENLVSSMSRKNTEVGIEKQSTLLLSNRDLNILAGTALLEAGSKCDEDALDVTHAIINRMNDPRWPSSIPTVVFQPKQFAAVEQISQSQISTSEGVINSLQRLRRFSYAQAKAKYDAYIQGLSSALKMKNSRDHVDGLVYFKGVSQYRYRHGSDPLRKNGCNFFHPDYGDSSQARQNRIANAPLVIKGRS